VGKYLGLDFGEKTIGVAVSHNGRTATGFGTLRRKDPAALRPALKELKTILRDNEIKNIVLGFPKNMDGEENPRCAETLFFKEKLEKYIKNINVSLWDERLSTRAVSRVYGGARKHFKKNADQMAAVYILQGFLDYINEGGVPMNDEQDFNELEDFEEEGLTIVDENGNEHPLQILSSRESDGEVYLLAIEPEAGEVYHFRCDSSEDEDEDIMLEQIDPEHKDYDRVFAMFKEDYEELGIEIED